MSHPRATPGDDVGARRRDPSWSDGLEGMNVTRADSAGGADQTVLVGRLPDQAALSGVLNTLYELHLPVLSVECLEAE